MYSPNNVRSLSGKKALTLFHKAMKEEHGSKFNLTYSQLEVQVVSRNPDFLVQLGDAVISSKFGERRLLESMERVVELTSVSPLKIPDVFGFSEGIAKELSSFDISLFGDAALDIGVDVSKGTVRVVNAVGSTAVTSVENAADVLKNSKWIILAVGIFAAAILWRISKNFKVSDLKPF